MKKYAILIIMLNIFMVGSISIYELNNNDEITIKIYNASGSDLKNKIVIHNKKEIRKFENMISEIHILESEEFVNLMLANEVEVIYKDKVLSTAMFELNDGSYMYYKKDKNSVFKMAYMKKDLRDFILKYIK